MKTIIAEKPSVAREIARIVGATEREEGYFTGNGYNVTWALGHLVQPTLPEGYGIKGFHRENLPIIPQVFALVPQQVKTDKGYKADAGVMKQIKVITRLFSECDKIIVATDAGREGELIFRYLYEYIGCATPFDRLWISSLTDKAIRDGLKNLECGSKYDNLYYAAKVRCGLMVPFSYPQGNTDYRKALYQWYNNGVKPASQQEWDALYERVHRIIQKEIYEVGASMGKNCEFYVNVGKAIYLGRQHKQLSKSGYKLQRSQNNTHLSEGLAMYIASLAYAYTLLDIKQEDVTFYPKYSKDPQLTGDRGKTDLIAVENTPALAKQARKVAWRATHKK